jgi:hypothetical protein
MATSFCGSPERSRRSATSNSLGGRQTPLSIQLPLQELFLIDAAKDIPAIAEFGLYWEAEECR